MKAHDETYRLLAELAAKQKQLAAIQARLAEAALRGEVAAMRCAPAARTTDRP